MKQQGKRVNIPRSIEDSHYRYTMPQIEAKVEGSGNGIKTKIPNMSDIAKDLHRDPADILKLFGFELGAVTIKNDESNTYIVNGQFTAQKLAEVLDLFIEKFVLCGSCRNPETRISPSKGQVKLRCISCGNETLCDPKHKLTDFILKDAARRKIKARQEAAESGKKKSGTGSGGSGGSSSSSKSKKDKNDGDDKDDDDDDDVDWSVDVSSAAVKARRRAALGASEDASAAAGAKGGKEEKKKPEDEFKEFIAATGPVDMEKLRVLRDALRLSPSELAERIARSIFDPDNIMKQIIPASKRWAPFFSQNRKAQDALVQAVVDMALVKEDVLLPNLATILKGLYDHDFVEEETILSWYDHVSVDDQRMLKAKLKVAPLAQWFKDAESDSE